MTGTGLATALQGTEANTITICENECVLDMDASDVDTARCTVPALATVYSKDTYNLVESAAISGTWSGSGSASELLKLTDGDNLNDYTDGTASGCYFSLSARSGYVFYVDEAKLFINDLTDKSPYIDGNLVLQGQNEGEAAWTDIWEITEDLHEGWNTERFETVQAFNTYRFYGATSGSCRVGEVKLVGVEVIDDDTN